MKTKPILNHLVTILFSSFLLVVCKSEPKNTLIKNTLNIPFEEITVAQLQQGYQDGTYTVTQVIQSYLNRIDAIDKQGPKLNAIIQVNPDALAVARQLDNELKEGKSNGA